MNPSRSLLASVRIAILLTSALLLASCGSVEESSEKSPSAPSTTGGADPVTVTDSRGEEIRLPRPAEDVVALEWSAAENLVTLGVMPVGVADVEGYATWVSASPLDDSVTDVGTRAEPSVDSIVALEPDLVVTEAERGSPALKKLEDHVPVVVLQGSDAGNNTALMRKNFELIAKATGTEDAAEQVLAEFDTAIAQGRQRLADAGVAGETFAMADGWTQGSSVMIRIFGQGSLMSELATELGLKNAWTGEVDSWGLAQTDVEGLTKLEDVHFFYSASEADVFADDLAKNSIWTSLPFVQQDQVYKLDSGTWTFGGPRSCMHVIDQIVATLAS